jgi:hypothetical protein
MSILLTIFCVELLARSFCAKPLLDLLQSSREIGLDLIIEVGGGDHLLHLRAHRREIHRRVTQMPFEAPHVLHRQIADLAKISVTSMHFRVEYLFFDASGWRRLPKNRLRRPQHRLLPHRMSSAAKARERLFVVDRFTGVGRDVLARVRRVHPAGRQTRDRLDPAHEFLAEFALAGQHQFQIARGEGHHSRKAGCRADLLSQQHQVCSPDREQQFVGIFHRWVFHLLPDVVVTHSHTSSF